MSTYFKMPNTAPSLLGRADYRYSVSMDMEQLLYMMEGVFGRVEYKYCTENERTNIVPIEEKKAEYDKLVDDSTAEFASNRILAVNKDGEEGFSEQDYHNIVKYENDNKNREKPKVRETLYLMCALTNWMNSTGRVGERENVPYYCLFTYQSGKEFVGYLVAMLLQLLIEYRDAGNEKAEKVISNLNRDYDSMQQFYSKAKEILDKLKRQNKEIQNSYDQNFFVNSSDILTDWILKQQNIRREDDIWEFIFRGNKEYGWKANMKLANNLLWHIVQISRLILHKEHGSIKWEEKLKKEAGSSDFQYLDSLIKELEENNDNPAFDKSNWIEKYIAGLSRLVDEKCSRIAG